MSDVAQNPPDPLAEPPEVHERNLWIGARIIAGTTIMFFLAFVFAYFYLRSLNNGGHWRPDRVDPPGGYGTAIVVLFAASAGSFLYAARAGKRGAAWIPAAAAALVLGLAACVVQVFEYANLGFGPQDGGYASVFMGWTIMFVVFALLALYWVEIVVAEGIRNRARAADGSAGELPAGLGDAAFYWALLATIGVLSWFVLYLL